MSNFFPIVTIFLCATIALCNATCGQLFDNKKWNDQLAASAQNLANDCEFRHDRFGQNIGWSSSPIKTAGADWSYIIQRWFDEHPNFHYPTTSTGETGHYTQIVWADTHYIGCGFTWYNNNRGQEYEKFYVCNYGPVGNAQGQPPYRI